MRERMVFGFVVTASLLVASGCQSKSDEAVTPRDKQPTLEQKIAALDGGLPAMQDEQRVVLIGELLTEMSARTGKSREQVADDALHYVSMMRDLYGAETDMGRFLYGIEGLTKPPTTTTFEEAAMTIVSMAKANSQKRK